MWLNNFICTLSTHSCWFATRYAAFPLLFLHPDLTASSHTSFSSCSVILQAPGVEKLAVVKATQAILFCIAVTLLTAFWGLWL
ncbi:hypothetical protein XENTR_v10016191 [Xenopus tropicalis]|nr:hypothetical protein XENTR_v10016191 [Xenopus tropicalis]